MPELREGWQYSLTCRTWEANAVIEVKVSKLQDCALELESMVK